MPLRAALTLMKNDHENVNADCIHQEAAFPFLSVSFCQIMPLVVIHVSRRW
jgi:hypothetical protein